jgi:sterol desaturase/sphingolipid hydroxylase (fatty acid hydroxylase superfamily)
MTTMHLHYWPIIIFVSLCIFLKLNELTKKHRNYKKRKLDHSYYTNVVINLFISLGLFALISCNYGFSSHLTPKLQNIIFYFMTTDALYYWIHRAIHKTPALKQFFHFTHHEAFHLVPMDVYYISHQEHILYLMIIFTLPLLFVHPNFMEYVAILLISLWHACYTHSEIKDNFPIPLFINSKYHKKHHKIGGGNYSIFFNIWDEYMGSNIKSNTPPPQQPQQPPPQQPQQPQPKNKKQTKIKKQKKQ